MPQIGSSVTILASTTALAVLCVLIALWALRGARLRAQRAHALQGVAHQRLQGVVAQSCQFAFAIGQDERIVWIHGAGVDAIGLRLAPHTGSHYSEAFAGWPALSERVEKALQGEHHRQRITDRGAPSDISLCPILGDDGQIVELLGVVVDASEANEATARADRLARFRSDFLAAMNFRLRALLTETVGVTELLEFAPLRPEERQLIEVIQNSNQKLLNFADDLIDFGELDAGRLELTELPFDLHAVLDALTEEFAPLAARHEVELITRYSHQLPAHFVGDAGRLRQILGNLIENGIEFTRRGHVVIDIQESEDQVNDTTITIAVEDTGPGVPDNEVRHLFDGLGTSSMQNGDEQGAGLGLAISQRLAEMMGGHLTLDNLAGPGAHFQLEVKLPRVATDADPTADGSELPIDVASIVAPATTIAAGRRVLLAEDSVVQQRIVERMLANLGLDVTVAVDGLDAVHAIDDDPYDIIFMDCQMPRVDGFQATAQIRARQDDRASIPIVAMTADAMPGDRERCLAAGMSDYLSKPVTSDQLRDVVLRWLSQSELADETANEEPSWAS